MKLGYLVLSGFSMGCGLLGGSPAASLESEVRRLRVEQERQSAQIEQLQNRVQRAEAGAVTNATDLRSVIRLGADEPLAEPIRIDSTERPEPPDDPLQEVLPLARISAQRGDRIPEGSGIVVHESDRLPVVPVAPLPIGAGTQPAPAPVPRAQPVAQPVARPVAQPAGRNQRVLPPMGTLDPAAARAYDAALAMARDGRCQEAIGAFTDFVSRYAEHPHADNAVYWRAECELRGGEVSRALADFEGLIARYPTGNKVPDALYKIAVIQRGLGEPTARGASELAAQRLLNEFPDSDAARRMRAER